jgi:hypothetical protein
MSTEMLTEIAGANISFREIVLADAETAYAVAIEGLLALSKVVLELWCEYAETVSVIAVEGVVALRGVVLAFVIEDVLHLFVPLQYSFFIIPSTRSRPMLSLLVFYSIYPPRVQQHRFPLSKPTIA